MGGWVGGWVGGWWWVVVVSVTVLGLVTSQGRGGCVDGNFSGGDFFSFFSPGAKKKQKKTWFSCHEIAGLTQGG